MFSYDGAHPAAFQEVVLSSCRFSVFPLSAACHIGTVLCYGYGYRLCLSLMLVLSPVTYGSGEQSCRSVLNRAASECEVADYR